MVARLIVSVVLGLVVHLGMSAGLVKAMDLSPLIASLLSSAMLTVICLGIAMIVPAIRREPTPGFEELMKLMDDANEWLKTNEPQQPKSKQSIVGCSNGFYVYVFDDGEVETYNNFNSNRITLKTSAAEQRQIRKKFKQLKAKLENRSNCEFASKLQERLDKTAKVVSGPQNPTGILKFDGNLYDQLIELYKTKQAVLDGYNASTQSNEDKVKTEAKLAILNNKIATQLAEIEKAKA